MCQSHSYQSKLHEEHVFENDTIIHKENDKRLMLKEHTDAWKRKETNNAKQGQHENRD